MPQAQRVELPAAAPAPEACGKCFGSGLEVVPGKGARRCECRRKGARERLVEAAGIPKFFRHCTLENFRAEQPHIRAFNYSFRLVREYPAVERGLLYTGPVGTGKTHLAVAVLNGLLEKGVPCLFYEFGTLLKEIQDSYNEASRTSELGVLEPVFRAEVLLLDELGAMRPTDWVYDTMMQIIGRRYNERRLTLFTTNYGDVRKHPADETLEDRIGVRLRSRLYDMCKTVEVGGDDYRRRGHDR